MEVVAYGFHERRLVFCKVRELHDAALALNEFDDRFSYAPLVESILSLFSEGSEGLSKIGQSNDLSRERRLSIQEHLVCIGRSVLDQVFGAFPL